MPRSGNRSDATSRRFAGGGIALALLAGMELTPTASGKGLTGKPPEDAAAGPSARSAQSPAGEAPSLGPVFASAHGGAASLDQGSAAPAEPLTPAPRRVVSMNLCTDQLAMLLADEGQLVSVSVLARDPLSSAMPLEALAYPANHGLAEEIFLMRPDLVLAEPFTRPATVALLRQLGVRVELIEPVNALSEVPEALEAVGKALGRPEAAAQAALRFRQDLAALRGDGALPDGAAVNDHPAAPPAPEAPQAVSAAGAAASAKTDAEAGAPPLDARQGGPAPRAAIYHANGYTTGTETLGGDILAAAGLANIADDFGLGWGGLLPLELLVLAQPEIVISGKPYAGRSRAEDLLAHPALAALRGGRISAEASDADWLCGTPHVLRAVAQMRSLGLRAGQGAQAAPPASEPASPPKGATE